jgi:hypothetical protein
LYLTHNATTLNLELHLSSGDGTLIATSTSPLINNEWHHIQVKTVLHSSAGSCEVRLDGVAVINVSGVQTASTSGSVTELSMSTDGSFDRIYDDLWVCDGVDASATQGRSNDTFLGDLKVSTLLPSANGDTTGWTPSTGTNHAALVDEVPPNTTDYISTSTSSTRDLFALGDLPGTAGNVYGLRVNFYGLKTDAGASSVKPVIKESGGTVTTQTARALSTTAANYSGDFIFTLPSAPTTPWAASDVNALQAGVELA